jgi:dTDP-4-dehydrorhamnose reductase
MLNILVTGSNGQLGSELRELVQRGTAEACTSEKALSDVQALAAPNAHYFFTDRNSLDITDATEVKKFIDSNNINTIINCAAYTAVDKAESDAINADKINHLAVKSLAELAKEKNIKLIHISTDYVFDGKNYKPYNEDDITNPNGVYGATKLAGENAMQEINPANSIIIRTSWVYSSFGANFVKTMLRLGKEKESLGVIYDQVGTPTYARDLAKAILDILPNIKNEKVAIYNYSNEGVLSWYDFAKEIMRMAKLDCIINPIETKEYPTPATRPHYSLLNKSKIKKEFGIIIPYWKDSLDKCLKIMGERR